MAIFQAGNCWPYVIFWPVNQASMLRLWFAGIDGENFEFCWRFARAGSSKTARLAVALLVDNMHDLCDPTK